MMGPPLLRSSLNQTTSLKSCSQLQPTMRDSCSEGMGMGLLAEAPCIGGGRTMYVSNRFCSVNGREAWENARVVGGCYD